MATILTRINVEIRDGHTMLALDNLLSNPINGEKKSDLIKRLIREESVRADRKAAK